MSDPNNIPPPPPQPENNPYPERPPIFDNPEAPEYQAADQQTGPGAPPPPPPHQSAPAGGTPTKDERNWAMFAHLSMLLLGLISAAIGLPVFGFLGPLVIYLMKKDESEFIADQAKEALNFSIAVSIVMLACVFTFFLIIPILIAVVVAVAAMILLIIAGIKASNGERYRYPFIFRLIN